MLAAAALLGFCGCCAIPVKGKAPALLVDEEGLHCEHRTLTYARPCSVIFQLQPHLPYLFLPSPEFGAQIVILFGPVHICAQCTRSPETTIEFVVTLFSFAFFLPFAVLNLRSRPVFGPLKKSRRRYLICRSTTARSGAPALLTLKSLSPKTKERKTAAAAAVVVAAAAAESDNV